MQILASKSQMGLEGLVQSSLVSHSTQRPVRTEQRGLVAGQSASLRQPSPGKWDNIIKQIKACSVYIFLRQRGSFQKGQR